MTTTYLWNPLPVVVPPVAEATAADAPRRRAASHHLWAMLLARIYETLPLVCPICQAQMRIIAFITDAGTVRKIRARMSGSKLAAVADSFCGLGLG